MSTFTVSASLADQIINRSPAAGLRIPTANVGAPEAATRDLVYTPDLNAGELTLYNSIVQQAQYETPLTFAQWQAGTWAPPANSPIGKLAPNLNADGTVKTAAIAAAVPAIPHTHAEADTTNLVTDLAAKAPATVNYLVGTADAGLSAEIAVGTTPGGELGGTWASPTVDATHSGSSHAGLSGQPGSTDVAVADGGTGSSTAGGARTNLGLVPGTDVASLTAGVVPIAQLATGTPSGSKFIRDDGTLQVPSGGSLTDHTHAVTGSGATGGGATLNPVTMKLPAAMGTTEGQVDWDATQKTMEAYDTQRERAVSSVGWMPFAVPMNYDPALAFTSSSTLAANGGSVAIPMFVPGHMLLQSVILRSNDVATARTWGWDLYVQRLNNGNAGENALDRVAACSANETFTPGAASTRTLTAGSAPVYLAPGMYWLVIQCRHATSNFAMGSTAVSAVAATLANANQAKTTTNPNGATLDFVAATWTKSTGIVGVALQGRVFGQTSAWT